MKNKKLYTYKATVNKIIDGDTCSLFVHLGFNVQIKLNLRLARINTPELSSKDVEIHLAAEKAKGRLKELLINPDVIIESSKPYTNDKYGRWIAEIVNDKDENISDVLLKEGLAVAFKK